MGFRGRHQKTAAKRGEVSSELSSGKLTVAMLQILSVLLPWYAVAAAIFLVLSQFYASLVANSHYHHQDQKEALAENGPSMAQAQAVELKKEGEKPCFERTSSSSCMITRTQSYPIASTGVASSSTARFNRASSRPSPSTLSRASSSSASALLAPETQVHRGSARRSSDPSTTISVRTPSSFQTKKTMRISSGSRFYANLISQRQKEEESLWQQFSQQRALVLKKAASGHNTCFERAPSSSCMLVRTQSTPAESQNHAEMGRSEVSITRGPGSAVLLF